MPVRKIAAIEKQRVVLPAQGGDKLVHNAAGHADKFVFRPARQFREVNRIEPQPGQALPESRGAHLHGRRGAQSRLARDVASEDQVGPGQRVAVGFKKLRNPAKVIAPGMLFVSKRLVEREFRLGVEIEGVSPHGAALAPAARKPHKSVYGDRQNEPIVVVRVLADQVDSSRRARDKMGLAAEDLFEFLFNHSGGLAWAFEVSSTIARGPPGFSAHSSPSGFSTEGFEQVLWPFPRRESHSRTSPLPFPRSPDT